MDVLIEELDASQLLAAPAAPAPPPAAPADRSADPGQPRFHVAPRCGWLNDPNGLIYYRGRYHLCVRGYSASGGRGGGAFRRRERNLRRYGTQLLFCRCTSLACGTPCPRRASPAVHPPSGPACRPRLPVCSFYQHVEQGCEWDWGLVSGHRVLNRALAPRLPTEPRLASSGTSFCAWFSSPASVLHPLPSARSALCSPLPSPPAALPHRCGATLSATTWQPGATCPPRCAPPPAAATPTAAGAGAPPVRLDAEGARQQFGGAF